jgi:LPXTG-site transpeptidase (sortase) family protein
MTPHRRHADALLRWSKRALLAVGIACLGWSAVVALQAVAHQREQRSVLNAMLTVAPLLPVDTATRPLERGSLVGALEVPRVGLSAMVLEGDDDATLRVGIGHLPDTPPPWQRGNSAFAGHRDTFFRTLQHVREGDRLSLTTTYGEFQYRVRETFIVGPEDLWVLNPTDSQTLTLVTCYPFKYVGPAPRRFVVQADRI